MSISQFFSDVQRSIGRSNISDGDEDDVDQRPDAEAAEAEQLADALLPVAQIEPESIFNVEYSTNTSFV